MDSQELFKQMGHGSFETTVRIYVHLKEDNGQTFNSNMPTEEIVKKYSNIKNNEDNDNGLAENSSNVIYYDFSKKVG